ncbi:MAG: ROK family protein [Dehalococcoidia bacterium]|nr:ROK family protein [Dehalococcoidia bacterium]
MNEDAFVVVNIDESLTEITLADKDCNIDLQEKFELQLKNIDRESFAWEIGGLISKTLGMENKKRSCKSIAISFPGNVDPLSGKIVKSPINKKLEDFSISDILKNNINCPIGIESHINNALIGENWQGIAQSVKNIIYVELQNLFNISLLIENQIVRGEEQLAGELDISNEVKQMQHLGGKRLEEIIQKVAAAALLLDTGLIIIDTNKSQSKDIISLLDKELKAKGREIPIKEPKLVQQNITIGCLKMALTLNFENIN